MRHKAILAAWMFLFLVVVLVYLPGLHGPFVLDDFGALAAIGDYGGVDDWETFKAFVFGGQAGPSGRPVALLTFLIDANNWPAESFPFKRTNLVIHLMNAALLGVLICQILILLRLPKQNALWLALAASALWVLHPFLVSTTLYAVQRMAQLSTMFILAGLTTYLWGRSWIAVNPVRAYLIMSLSVGCFAILAVLSKENGILLPMLIGVVEVTVVASQGKRLASLNRYWAIVFLILPSLLILAYLGRALFDDNFFEVVPPREFSLYERSLTQSRILIDYLQHWFIPKLYTTGIFQDHFIKSTGFFSPLSTALSIGFHLIAISFALIQRRRWPLFALAILFFYASHLLESTVLNLELYFEHRNYLAACFLFLPLVVSAWENLSSVKYYSVVATVVLVLGSFTYYSSTVWASYPTMVEASARKAPLSVRAQAQHAVNIFNAGRVDESLQILEQAINDIPGVHPLLLVNRTSILCSTGALNEDETARVTALLTKTHYDPRLLRVFSSLITAVMQGRCPDVSVRSIREMFVGMLSMPTNNNPSSMAFSQIQYLIGWTHSHDGERSLAVAAFELSLQARPGPSQAMQMAAIMASDGFGEEALLLSNLALEYLDAEQQLMRRSSQVNRTDIKTFQATVRADMNETPSLDTSNPAP